SHSHVSPSGEPPRPPPKSTVRARPASYAIALDQRPGGPGTTRRVHVFPSHSHVSSITGQPSPPPNRTVTPLPLSYAIAGFERPGGDAATLRKVHAAPSHSQVSPAPLPPKSTMRARAES